jgi:hyperosmotically inducible protein
MKRNFGHSPIYAAALAGALMFASSGLAADKNDKNPQHVDPYVTGPNGETRLVQEIRHQLVMLPFYTVFDDLGFTVTPDGRVTLMGDVLSPGILKTDAERVVKKVEGVTSVTNNIEILPLSDNDDRIRHAVFRAIYGDSALATRYGFQALPSIHIIVKNGNVRLEGVVANEFDKNLAYIRANGVPGAFKVVNDLQVEQKEAKK